MSALHAEPPPATSVIPVVGTWGELLSVEPFWTDLPSVGEKGTNGFPAPNPVRVRLGIDRVLASPGDGVVLYCLVDSPREQSVSIGGPGSLGPLEVLVGRPDKDAPKIVDELMNVAGGTVGRRLLFMKVIPLPEAGTYRIRVAGWDDMGRGRREQARVSVKATGERAQPWYPWAPVADTAAHGMENGVQVAVVSNPKGGPALPTIQGDVAQAVPDPIGPKMSLPLLVSKTPSDHILLRPEEGGLLADLDDKYDLYHARYLFLTRWWINGLPLVMPGEFVPEPESIADGRLVQNAQRIRFKVELDAKRLGVAEGDAVALQVLLCPFGWDYSALMAPRLMPPQISKEWKKGAEPPPELTRLFPRADYVVRGGDLVPAK